MNTRLAKTFCLALAMFVALLLSGCSTAPKTAEERAELEREATASLAKAKTNDPTLAGFINPAPGYAVFPTVGKGAIGIGGAYGKGVLFERGSIVGYCDLSQGTIGFQLGGQAYTEIIVFENQQAVDTFKQGNFRFSAQATAVALRSGVGANAKFESGVAVFTMDEAGLMYEASIGGQMFGYQAR